MKVISTNIGKATTIVWNNKKEQTGIFKYPTTRAIRLEKNAVLGDTLIDKIHHGGINKACYLFSADYYDYWKERYPDLKWDWGMFGENLTISNLDEAVLGVGDIYKLGETLVEITQPREPCYKLGVRFETQKILKQFIKHNHPGTYIKILEEGKVRVNDTMVLFKKVKNSLTIQQFYKTLYQKEKNQLTLQSLMNCPNVEQQYKNTLSKYLK